MDQHIMNYIKHINPFIEEEHVEEAYMVNDYDLFVKLKDGRKYLYDTFNGYFNGFYESDHILTDEQWGASFKIRLRKLMNRKHITQEELAELIGVSRITIHRYVNGESIPSAITLKKISQALNYPLDEFFYKEY